MKTVHLETNIPETLVGLRLDQALSQLFSQYSRAQLQTWIREGAVTLNGIVITKPRHKIELNTHVIIAATLTPKTDWGPEAIALNIIYEDDCLIIVNKPTGLVVHPGAGNPNQTLVNALLHHDATLAHLPRAGLVHRLDKETSGLLVVARNLAAYHALTQAMQARTIRREYEAIVHGKMISGGTIEADIGRHPTQRTRMSVVRSGGRAARTHYRIVERYRAHTRIRVVLDTGRTHQIRVHMQHIHHPLVGDATYGKRHGIANYLSSSLQDTLQHFTRQALHAIQLSLTHPQTGTMQSWQAPIPDDMAKLITALQQDINDEP